MRKKGKKYTAKTLKAACDAYFARITYRVPAMREEIALKADGTPELDYYGHPKRKYVQIIAGDGQPAELTKWTEQPSVASLCIWLGINRSTLAKYGAHDPEKPESAAMSEVVQEAKAKIETYLSQKLEDKGAANGTKFALSHNFGWGKAAEEENAVEIRVKFGEEGGAFD